MIKIYTANYCPFCKEAIELLFVKGASFEVVNVTKNTAARDLLAERTGCKTIPQVFVGDKFIGGCSDLKELEENGELDTILKEGL